MVFRTSSNRYGPSYRSKQKEASGRRPDRKATQPGNIGGRRRSIAVPTKSSSGDANSFYWARLHRARFGGFPSSSTTAAKKGSTVLEALECRFSERPTVLDVHPLRSAYFAVC